ncbi:MAG: phosphoenolpyruvate--protein phosphotransferase, partial [Verrucomicrobiae bacterium]|nr:phosphoenolpyruvate--protein phosphotransferase [Verrucomicrobiae bacterium]
MQSTEKKTEIRLRGIGVSPGISHAPIRFAGTDSFEEPERRALDGAQVDFERERLQRAVTRTREQIREMQREIDGTLGAEHAGIFDAHLLVLEDSAVLEEVIRTLEKDRVNVEWAYWGVINRYLESLRKIPDPYLRERAIDIEDVARRVLKNLRHPDGDAAPAGFAAPGASGPAILAAHDLTPSDTVGLDRERVLGFATEAGSPTSHTAIIAR